MPHTNVIFISKPGLPHLSVLQELPPSAHVTVGNSMEELEPAIEDVNVIVNGNFSREPFHSILGRAKHLQWVHSLSAGVEATLTPELKESPVPLTNARGVFRESLGEFSVAAMLYFAKSFRRMIKSQAAEQWDPFDIEMLDGAVLGVVGYGEIGRAAARLAKAFGVRVLALRRRSSLAVSDGIADAFYEPAQLLEMLSQCDYVVVAAPKTPETVGLIGAREIAAMKPTAVLINVGRGPVIDEAAMIEALEQKRIKGAGLDVFDHEPLPKGHPFYRLENVLLSPHCADHTSDWLHQAVRKFVENYRHFEAGEPLDNIVDKHAGY